MQQRLNPLASQLKWLIGIRLAVVTSGFLLYFLLQVIRLSEESEVSMPLFYPLAAGVYGASLLYVALLKVLDDRLKLQAYIQFLGDLLFITGLVWAEGGVSSPFSILYLVVISVAASLLRRRAAMDIALIAWLLYAGLLVGLFYGLIPPPPGPLGATAEPTPFNLLVYNLFSHLLGFAGVAVLTSHLARDITRVREELVQTATHLEQLEVLHRDVIESIASGILTTDLEGTIVSANRAAAEILGRNEATLVGLRVEDSGLMSRERWEHLTSNRQERVRDEGLVERENDSLWVGYSVNDLLNPAGERRGTIVIFQDLTSWRELQEEVQMKDRMAAVGELAAGIAHEIGNPLAAISGSVQMLNRRQSSNRNDGSDAKLLDIILQESRRLDRTIKGFLQFARPKDRSAVQFDIAKLLTENVTLLKNSEEVTDRHAITITLDTPSAHVVGDPDQITQIFWNLTRNSIRAMPNGGTLEVEGTLDDGDYIIRFRDDGRGMSEKERSNLFHPFRTFFDGGTGIGMAIVYRIVEEHGGRISVRSEQGSGTVVEVALPSPVAPQALPYAEVSVS